MRRLTIDITEQQHQSLKALAALQGKTIKQYAIERLFPVDAGDDEPWLALKALLEKRIAQGQAGSLSDKDFGSIVDDELGTEKVRGPR
jgi:hypothetical protein